MFFTAINSITKCLKFGTNLNDIFRRIDKQRFAQCIKLLTLESDLELSLVYPWRTNELDKDRIHRRVKET